tara:strand:- start:84 stop:266 length:183 start_codon:yes stop_codon:yes gene_type:complete
MEILSEYMGSDRTAKINLSAFGYEVDLYQGETLVETRQVHDKSLSYAESVAENWTLGVIE